MSTRHAGATPTFIHAFTGVRAVGAFVVIVWHMREIGFLLLPATVAAGPLIDVGILGLDAFFVLSGFVIAHNYADKLADLDRRKYRTYLAARFARVYPVHLFALLGTALLVWYVAQLGTTLSTESSYSLGTFVGNLFLLQGIPGVDAWNVPAGSVSCEFAAYLVFPLVAARLVRLRWTTALALAALAIGAQTAALLSITDPALLMPSLYWLRIAGEFTAGALLWAAWRRRGRIGPWWDVVAVLAVAGMVVVVAVRHQPFYAATPFVPLLILAVAGATGPVRMLLTARPVLWFGERSLSLYLTHSPVMIVLMFFVLPPAAYLTVPLWQRIGVLVAYFVVCVVVAEMVYRFVEEPGRRWLRARGPAWPTAGRPSDRGPLTAPVA